MTSAAGTGANALSSIPQRLFYTLTAAREECWLLVFIQVMRIEAQTQLWMFLSETRGAPAVQQSVT